MQWVTKTIAILLVLSPATAIRTQQTNAAVQRPPSVNGKVPLNNRCKCIPWQQAYNNTHCGSDIACQNRRDIIHASHGSQCGLGLEFWSSEVGMIPPPPGDNDPTELRAPSNQEWLDDIAGEKLNSYCKGFYEKLNDNSCVNINIGADAGQWCYTSSDCTEATKDYWLEDGAQMRVKSCTLKGQEKEYRVRYLPKYAKGKSVLSHEGGILYRADNRVLNSASQGIAFRFSKSRKDKDGDLRLEWGDIVEGTDEGDGWIRVEMSQDHGTNRFSPAQLHQLAVSLDVPLPMMYKMTYPLYEQGPWSTVEALWGLGDSSAEDVPAELRTQMQAIIDSGKPWTFDTSPSAGTGRRPKFGVAIHEEPHRLVVGKTVYAVEANTLTCLTHCE